MCKRPFKLTTKFVPTKYFRIFTLIYYFRSFRGFALLFSELLIAFTLPRPQSIYQTTRFCCRRRCPMVLHVVGSYRWISYYVNFARWLFYARNEIWKHDFKFKMFIFCFASTACRLLLVERSSCLFIYFLLFYVVVRALFSRLMH